jgi:hypothetical protein
MSDLIHIAALGGLVVLLARMSLAHWGSGSAGRPAAVRFDGTNRDRWSRRGF